VTEVPSQTASAPRPKRRYTVSAKVRDANRRNLKKANAAPKERRYRLTPKRLDACRRNLLKASTARNVARPPRRGPWTCRSVLKAARRWGRDMGKQIETRKRRVLELLMPNNPNQAKPAEGIAEALGRCLSVVRGQMDRERAGLLRIWLGVPQDARSAAQLGCRLVGVFRDEAWMEQALDRLTLRLRSLARLFAEVRNGPTRELLDAVKETSAEALGNPFRPLDSPRMAAVLAEPAEEMQAGQHEPQTVLSRSPAEKRERAENLQSAKPDQTPGSGNPSDSETEMPNTKSERHARRRRSPAAHEWPATFQDYHALVERSLGAGEELAPLIERIARLSWQRHEILEHLCSRAFAAIEQSLNQCSPNMPPHLVVWKVLEPLRGADWRGAQNQARQLEKELVEALGDYLQRRYGVQPAGDTDDFVSEPQTPNHEPGTTNPVFRAASEPQDATADPKPPTPAFEPAAEPQDPDHEPRTPFL
jgi:hypothetical protein